MARPKQSSTASRDRLRRPGGTGKPRAKPIWELFDEISRQIPQEELDKLPVDGAEQHDHYLYGWPKKKR